MLCSKQKKYEHQTKTFIPLLIKRGYFFGAPGTPSDFSRKGRGRFSESTVGPIDHEPASLKHF